MSGVRPRPWMVLAGLSALFGLFGVGDLAIAAAALRVDARRFRREGESRQDRGMSKS